MHIRSGNALLSSTKLLSTHSSAPSIGSIAGLEPVATTITGALNCSSPTCTVDASTNTASPLITVALDSIISTFLRICETMESLRSTADAKSGTTFSSVMPYLCAFLTISTTSADLHNAFVGIHPLFKQVPPILSFSISMTFFS